MKKPGETTVVKKLKFARGRAKTRGLCRPTLIVATEEEVEEYKEALRAKVYGVTLINDKGEAHLWLERDQD